MLVKKSHFFLEFSTLSACCIVDGFPRTRLELLNSGHSSVMVSFHCHRVAIILRYVDVWCYCELSTVFLNEIDLNLKKTSLSSRHFWKKMRALTTCFIVRVKKIDFDKVEQDYIIACAAFPRPSMMCNVTMFRDKQSLVQHDTIICASREIAEMRFRRRQGRVNLNLRKEKSNGPIQNTGTSYTYFTTYLWRLQNRTKQKYVERKVHTRGIDVTVLVV